MRTNNLVSFSNAIMPKMVNDKFDHLKFHIEKDNYFGTLASILFLLLQEKKKQDKLHYKATEKTIENLMYLQKRYKITKK